MTSIQKLSLVYRRATLLLNNENRLQLRASKFQINKSICAIFMTALASLLLCGCGAFDEEVPELLEPATAEEVYAEVTRHDVYELTTYEAVIVPQMTQLSFSEKGKLGEMFVVIGDEVVQGQVLARLEGNSDKYDELCEQLENMRAENRYNNLQMEIEIESGKTDSKDMSRTILLYEHQKKIQGIEENYLRKQIAFEKEKLSGNEIIAPCDGKIVAIKENLKYGDYMEAQVPVIVIAEDDKVMAYCDYLTPNQINEYDEIKGCFGGCTYALEYIPYEEGYLKKLVADGEDFYSNFDVLGAARSLIGETGDILCKKKLRENVITVPNNALISEGNTGYVYVMRNGEKVNTQVKLGVEGVMYTEIIEGLSEGEVVYVTE